MAYRHTENTLRKKAETRQRILDAAHRIVAARGFGGLTMQGVADAAGVASGNLYRYFANKGALCAEVFRRASAAEVEQVRAALATAEETGERFLAAVERFARRALKGRTLAWALIAEPVDPAVDAERLRYRQAYADLFARALDEGIASGELPPQSSDVGAHALVGVMAETLVGPLAPDVESLSEAGREGLIADIQKFCLRAIACKPHGSKEQ